MGTGLMRGGAGRGGRGERQGEGVARLILGFEDGEEIS